MGFAIWHNNDGEDATTTATYPLARHQGLGLLPTFFIADACMRRLFAITVCFDLLLWALHYGVTTTARMQQRQLCIRLLGTKGSDWCLPSSSIMPVCNAYSLSLCVRLAAMGFALWRDNDSEDATTTATYRLAQNQELGASATNLMRIVPV